MQNSLTVPNITFAIGIIGILFSVYNYLRNPQIQSDKNDSILSVGVAQLGRDLANLRDNHIHSIDMKMGEQDKAISLLTIAVTRLETIIDERIPKRKP